MRWVIRERREAFACGRGVEGVDQEKNACLSLKGCQRMIKRRCVSNPEVKT